MRDKDQDTLRIRRYRTVLDAALAHRSFAMGAIKRACHDEKPAFVTRVLSELEKDGLLERSGPRSRPSFRWRQQPAAFCASTWIDATVRGAKIRRAPLADRPRERLVAHEAAALRTAELLAILIRTWPRGESALQGAERIANRLKDTMENLPEIGAGELRGLSPVVSEAAFCQIMAGASRRRPRTAIAERPGASEVQRTRSPTAGRNSRAWPRTPRTRSSTSSASTRATASSGPIG